MTAPAHTVTTKQQNDRWVRLLRTGRIMCPAGHHFKKDFHIGEHGMIRCKHWIADKGHECGRWIFILGVRGGSNIVAEVYPDERARMTNLSTPAELLDFLGIFED